MAKRTLVAVLSNPSTTSGTRTRARVEKLAGLMSFDEVRIGNLFVGATKSFDDLGHVAIEKDGWMAARRDLSELLAAADCVLCAWGTRAPPGAARVWHREQVAWLCLRLHECGVPIVTVGDKPRHPSRWQRWTAANHPGVSFTEALSLSCHVQQPPVDSPVAAR